MSEDSKGNSVGTVPASPSVKRDETSETIETHETLHTTHTTHTTHTKAAAAGLSKKQAVQLAWKRGKLRYKLDPGQRTIYDAVKKGKSQKFYVNLPRRRGKSFLLCNMAIEYAIANPGWEIKYAAPTAKAVKKIIRPLFKKILRDCPADMRPKWMALDGEFVFPNGSIITVAGCDNQNYETLRGTEAHLCIVDEAGFVDELAYIVNDVLTPMTLETGGNIIIASTPPRSPAHEAVKIAESCIESGTYFHQTIYDNPRLTPAMIEGFIRKQAGMMNIEDFKKTATFRREYMAEFVVDLNFAVVPEWADMGKSLVREEVRPTYFDSYVSLDIGWRDGMGILYGYWDFRNAWLVIEDEDLLFKSTTSTVADAIRTKEDALWKEQASQRGFAFPYLRIADNDLLTIHDLASTHGLAFVPTAKDDKELQVNNLRDWVRAQKIVVNPRCRRLIHQLETTIWNAQRTTYERNTDGHGDLVDALVYLVRNVRRTRNPYPAVTGPSFDEMWTQEYFNHKASNGNAILKIFGKTKAKS